MALGCTQWARGYLSRKSGVEERQSNQIESGCRKREKRRETESKHLNLTRGDIEEKERRSRKERKGGQKDKEKRIILREAKAEGEKRGVETFSYRDSCCLIDIKAIVSSHGKRI